MTFINIGKLLCKTVQMYNYVNFFYILLIAAGQPSKRYKLYETDDTIHVPKSTLYWRISRYFLVTSEATGIYVYPLFTEVILYIETVGKCWDNSKNPLLISLQGGQGFITSNLILYLQWNRS